MSKPKLNFRDLSDQVWYVMKIRQDNYVTNCIDTQKMKLSFHDQSNQVQLVA